MASFKGGHMPTPCPVHPGFVLNARISFDLRARAMSPVSARRNAEIVMNIPNIINRPDFFVLENGEKAPLAFSSAEYENRLNGLRASMAEAGQRAVVLTSMHAIVYYSGFMYCSFGRPYACVVTAGGSTIISANIDAGQPWRRCHGDNLIYTDWKRENYLRAIHSIVGEGGTIGVEYDHLSLDQFAKFRDVLKAELTDVSAASMLQRMVKSDAEIALIKEGARIADLGGEAIRAAIHEGTREIDVAQAGRNAMVIEIARAFPDSELCDTWVWFQSGINTDGAHNPLTTRKLQRGDILSLNTFPMISSYYTALERTLFLGEPDARSLEIWEANVAVHERGIELIKPGAVCSDIVAELNDMFAERGLLEYRSFGYGHSFGVLSHYYGREAGLELREDIDTVLEPGMTFHFMPGLWMDEWGLEITESILIREDGPAETFCNRPRKLFVKP